MSKNTQLGNLVNGIFVDSSRNVGVGTTTPANALVVDRGNATASYLQFTAGTTTGVLATDGFEVGIDASGNGIISQQENLPLMIYTNAAERMRITATGLVGIGTDSPNNYGSTTVTIASSTGTNTAALVLRNSTSTVRGHYYSDGANSLMVLGSATAHPLTFVTGDTERMRINSTGVVGIGSAPNGGYSADYKLQVGVETSTNGIMIRGSSSGIGKLSFDAGTNGDGLGRIWYDYSVNSLLFYTSTNGTNSFERMRITSAGNVGINTTTANSRLTVFGNIEIIPPTTSNAKIRLVTCHGDGGLNQVQVYWNIAFGAKAAGGCLGAYDTGGNYAAPSANIAGSSLWTIYGFIGV
jgi:hypothetical protein